MSYISVAEEEGGEPIELPTEEDGTGGRNCQSSIREMLGPRSIAIFLVKTVPIFESDF